MTGLNPQALDCCEMLPIPFSPSCFALRRILASMEFLFGPRSCILY